MAAQIFYANDYKYMVCSTPLNATTGYRPFFDLLVYGDNASNQGCLSPGMLICTANPYSDHIDHDNRFDAVIGMPHFDNKAEVNYFKENGAGACFKGSSSNPVMSMLIPDLCKAPSRFILVADSTNAAVTNKVENKGGKLGVLLFEHLEYEVDSSGAPRPQCGRLRRWTCRDIDGR